MATVFRPTEFDPLALALRPPPGETPFDRALRIDEENDARRRNDEIDQQLKEDAARQRRSREGQRTLLLLGQAEAGKTTILKQMRMLYSPAVHDQERATWRPIVQLNLIAAVNVLLSTYDEYSRVYPEQAAVGQPPPQAAAGDYPLPPADSQPRNPIPFLRLRLVPVLALEAVLRRKLGIIGDVDDPLKPSSDGSTAPWKQRIKRSGPLLVKAGWQERLQHISLPLPGSPKLRGSYDNDRASVAGSAASRTSKRSLSSRLLGGGGGDASLLGRRSSSKAQRRNQTPPRPLEGALQGDIGANDEAGHDAPSAANKETRQEDRVDPTTLLASSKDVIEWLWNLPLTRKLRKQGKLLSLSESGDSTTYFLNNVSRIASLDYRHPSDEDILHARVRTLGVSEETFTVSPSVAYRVIDVGGSSCQRNVWASYFDDAQAIIFLAPISAFDQRLAEDKSINRVDDSLDLFAQIVENRLLARVSLVLFLNKIDILEWKVRAGVQVRRYFAEYRGKNEYDEVWKWFREKFRRIVSSRRDIAPERSVYVHTTVATSIKQTKAIFTSVNDSLLREHLKRTGFA